MLNYIAGFSLLPAPPLLLSFDSCIVGKVLENGPNYSLPQTANTLVKASYEGLPSYTILMAGQIDLEPAMAGYFKLGWPIMLQQ